MVKKYYNLANRRKYVQLVWGQFLFSIKEELERTRCVIIDLPTEANRWMYKRMITENITLTGIRVVDQPGRIVLKRTDTSHQIIILNHHTLSRLSI